MNLQDYLEKKRERAANEERFRTICGRCKKPEATCYCAEVRPFASHPSFAILMHPAETRRAIATGRMTHLSLSNSFLFEGDDFTHHPGVNALIADPGNHCVVLSPGIRSINLSECSLPARQNFFPHNRRSIVFVIDGTWSQARKMKRLSSNLHRLPMVCFTPTTPSAFHVRRQPAAYCYSTIEAVHKCISLADPEAKADSLLSVFSFMVDQQLRYQEIFGVEGPGRGVRRNRSFVAASAR